MFPIETQAGSLQADDTEINGIAGCGKSSGKVELDVGRRFCASHVGSEDFKSNLRLTHGSAETRLRGTRRNMLGKVWEVEAVRGSDVAEGIHEHNSGEPGPVLGGRFYLRLVLLVNPRTQQGCRLFELL